MALLLLILVVCFVLFLWAIPGHQAGLSEWGCFLILVGLLCGFPILCVGVVLLIIGHTSKRKG